MSTTQGFDWAETEIAKLAPQLTTIGVQLATPLGASFGVSAADATHWQQGAAIVNYIEARIAAVRGYSAALTNWRDNFLIDRTPDPIVMPQLTLPPVPADVQAAFGSGTFLTDFLDWGNKLISDMEKNGLTDAEKHQLGLLVPPPATPKDQMQPVITSIHEHANGHIEVNFQRKNQPQIKATVTLDDGTVLDKTLPSAKVPFALPTDRVHSFTVVAQYADKFGTVYGLVSDSKTGRSEL